MDRFDILERPCHVHYGQSSTFSISGENCSKHSFEVDCWLQEQADSLCTREDGSVRHIDQISHDSSGSLTGTSRLLKNEEQIDFMESIATKVRAGEISRAEMEVQAWTLA
jgi:hypothetical protein